MRKESQHHIMEEEKGLAFYFIFTPGIRKAKLTMNTSLFEFQIFLLS